MVDHDLDCRRFELEEQLLLPWNWIQAHYRQLDGWEINENRNVRDRFMQEVGQEHGAITVPHRQR